MKRFGKIFSILLLIAVTVCCLAACTKDALFFGNIKGATDIVVDDNAKTVKFKVEASADKFQLSALPVINGATLVGAFKDIDCTEQYVDFIPLSPGLNRFYVKLSVKTEQKKDNSAVSATSATAGAMFADGETTEPPAETAKTLVYEFSVTRAEVVAKKTVASISATVWKTAYNVGDRFVSGSINVIYSDSSEETVAITAAMLSGFDTATVGDKTVTITYGGKTTTATITVSAVIPQKTLSSVAIKNWQTDYVVGETFTAGNNLTATYSDSSEETIAITAAMLSGFDTATVGDKTVTITYGGKTTTATISVSAAQAPATIASVALGIWQNTYELNANFAVGQTVLVTYTDNTTKSFTVTTAMLTGFDTATAGEKTVTITYEGHTVTAKIIVESPSAAMKASLNKLLAGTYKKVNIYYNHLYKTWSQEAIDLYFAAQSFFSDDTSDQIYTMLSEMGFTSDDVDLVTEHFLSILDVLDKHNVFELFNLIHYTEDYYQLYHTYFSEALLADVKTELLGIFSVLDDDKLVGVGNLIIKLLDPRTITSVNNIALDVLIEDAVKNGYQDAVTALNRMKEMGQYVLEYPKMTDGQLSAAGKALTNFINRLLTSDTKKQYETITFIVNLLTAPNAMTPVEQGGLGYTYGDIATLATFASDLLKMLCDGVDFAAMTPELDDAYYSDSYYGYPPALMFRAVGKLGGALPYLADVLSAVTPDNLSEILLDIDAMLKATSDDIVLHIASLAVKFGNLIHVAEATMLPKTISNFETSLKWFFDISNPSISGETALAEYRALIALSATLNSESLTTEQTEDVIAKLKGLGFISSVSESYSSLYANLQKTYVKKGTSIHAFFGNTDILELSFSDPVTGEPLPLAFADTKLYLDGKEVSAGATFDKTSNPYFIIKYTADSQTYQASFSVFVYDDDSYKNFVPKIDNNIQIENGAIISLNALFQHKELGYNIILNEQHIVNTYFDSPTEGIQRAFVVLRHDILGDVCVPYNFGYQDTARFEPSVPFVVNKPYEADDFVGTLYKDNTSTNVTFLMLEGLDLTKPGAQTVTINYLLNGVSSSLSVQVFVAKEEWLSYVETIRFQYIIEKGKTELLNVFMFNNSNSFSGTVAKINESLAKYGLSFTLTGFDTSTVTEPNAPRFATLKLFKDNKEIYSRRVAYIVTLPTPSLSLKNDSMFLPTADNLDPDSLPSLPITFILDGSEYIGVEALKAALIQYYGDPDVRIDAQVSSNKIVFDIYDPKGQEISYLIVSIETLYRNTQISLCNSSPVLGEELRFDVFVTAQSFNFSATDKTATELDVLLQETFPGYSLSVVVEGFDATNTEGEQFCSIFVRDSSGHKIYRYDFSVTVASSEPAAQPNLS